MHERILRRLDFDYYNRLFSKITGNNSNIAVFDRKGDIVWIAEDLKDKLNIPSEKISQLPSDIDYTYLTLKTKNYLFCPIKICQVLTGWIALPCAGESSDEHSSLVEACDLVCQGIFNEFSLNKELENMTGELSERYEELNLIYKMGNLSKNYGLENEVFNQMVKLCATALSVEAVFFVVPKQNQVYYALGSHGNKIDISILLDEIHGKIFPFVSTSKESVIINNLIDPMRDLIFRWLPYKLFASPILIKNRGIAVLIMLRQLDQPDFTNSDHNLIEVMSNQISILLQNQRMYTEVELFTEQMAAALIESIDAKDPYTRGHSDRVNSYSVEIAKTLGLQDSSVRVLYWASLLHDLGKIGIPDSVLTKPGPLSEDEYILVKTHPERGYIILKHIERLRAALPGIRHHHEHYDGRGYPHGLKEKEIPLHARIIAVADCYDAMTSTRSYRPARTHQEAMEEIKRVAGTQLDKEIVEAWLALVNNR